MKTLLFTLVVGCTPSALTIGPTHPAHPDAAAGRLAGPPAALRPGVVDSNRTEPPATAPQPPAHQGHEGQH